jgi:hypothetical protein
LDCHAIAGDGDRESARQDSQTGYFVAGQEEPDSGRGGGAVDVGLAAAEQVEDVAVGRYGFRQGGGFADFGGILLC